ncbi:Uncharacterised protein [Mycobacteroides abscessus subsp. abscessus]|jgi:hypothetical protein|nr:Uncharacterised protein [Mycobacteroides abscessus subsp. abscessus]SKL80160.1 Uncharacterised protein [Mycobacteroides abscessus subsp. abscessus]SKM53425.1 Uncharacterised protein [Mycobacteroides abscessus subsp. abscessus]SLK34849.1 Uncharacterised protein [Mycobacteroides abscessus subsp. abscessus]
MATATETDVTSLVNSAFSEMECFFKPGAGHRDHSGNTAALLSSHGSCGEGLVCEAHYREFTDEILPGHARVMEQIGYIKCIGCGQKFKRLDDFVKAYPV